MPEFRLAAEIDGVPTSLRPGDARVGAAFAATPIPANGEVKRLDETLANVSQLVGYRLTVAPADPFNPTDVVRVSAYSEEGDGGGAEFVYDPTPPSGAYVIQVKDRLYKLAPTPGIRPSVFGCKGNATANDYDGLLKYRNWAILYNEPMRLDGRTYNVGTNQLLPLNGVKIIVAPGARIKGYVDLNNDIDVDGELPIDYDDSSLRYTYICSPKPEIDVRPVKSFLTTSAISRRALTNTANWLPTRWGFPLGDADMADDTTAAFDDLNYIWPDLNGGQPIRVALAPAIGGHETSWVWSGVDPVNAVIGLAVSCTQGKVVFLCSGDAFQITRYEKAVGAAESQAAFTWQGAGVDAAWRPRLCRWAYRISRTLRAIELLFNGVVVHRYTLPSAMGWIVNAGPAVFGVASANVSAFALVRDDREHFVGGPAVSIAVFGDSKSDTVSRPESPGRYPVQWPHYLPAWLDGSGGVRVAALTNLAEGGTTMAQARARFTTFMGTAAGISSTVVIIASGTNDIQLQTPTANVYADLAWMVDQAQAAGKHVVIVGPDSFYAKDLVTGGTGVLTSFSALGATIRAVIQQVAAAKGCGYVDGQSAIGLELADWINDNDHVTMPRLIDNLHGGPLYAAQMGHAIAHEVMRLLILPAKGAVKDLPMPAMAALNGYAVEPGSVLDRSADGLITLDLTVSAPSYGEVDNVIRLPRNFWPRRRVEGFVQYNNIRGVVIIYGLEDGPVAGLVQIIGLADNAPATALKVCSTFSAAFG